MSDYRAINRKLTCQILGRARLILSTTDWEQIEEWIDTCSPEADAAMARWDPQGRGYTRDTVAYDLAHLGARAVAAARAIPGRAKSPVRTTFTVTVGDNCVRFALSQEHKRGDLVMRIVDWAPDDRNNDLPDVAVNAIKRGYPVWTWNGQGFDNLTALLSEHPAPGPRDI